MPTVRAGLGAWEVLPKRAEHGCMFNQCWLVCPGGTAGGSPDALTVRAGSGAQEPQLVGA